MRCLSKKPENRYSDFTGLREAIEAVYDAFHVKKPFARSRPLGITRDFELMSRCYSMLTLRQFKEAYKIGKALIEFKPQMAEAWNNTAIALGHMGELDKACKYFKRAIELDLGYVVAMVNLGGVLNTLERTKEARQWLERAVECDPTYAEAWAILGACFAQTGNIRRASECFDGALEADPGYWKVWLIIAEVCLNQHNAQEALECCNRVKNLSPLLGHIDRVADDPRILADKPPGVGAEPRDQVVGDDQDLSAVGARLIGE